MIFRQLFDSTSSTYTYIIANRRDGEALIIDPVLDKVDHYIEVLNQLGTRLVKAVDTHTHADHITGLGALRDRTSCVTVMGTRSNVDVVSMRVDEGDHIETDGIVLKVIHTPGHTDDSYSFLMEDRVFTGDALLIRGTGRTDFQNGDPYAAYDSLFNKLLKLPAETLVYPAHDYKGDTVSTVGEEKAYNSRLQVSSAHEYAEIMNNLNLPDPRMMDVAIPANLSIGLCADDPAIKSRTLEAGELIESTSCAVFVDLREDSECERDGVIPGSVHVPYVKLQDYIKPGGMLSALAKQMDRDLILYCAYGERSALALKAMLDNGLQNVKHMAGGLDAWCKLGGKTLNQKQSS